MEKGGQYVGGKGGQQIEGFATLIKSFRISAENKDAFETATLIAKNSGMVTAWSDGMHKVKENITRMSFNSLKEMS